MSFDEIIKSHNFSSIEAEVEWVASSIQSAIAEGLRPEDILVVTVDDKFAKRYLADVEHALGNRGIRCNNLHSDSFGLRDFSKEDRVTLATVHKAKGNEAFMVFVIGVDAVMSYPDVRQRNMLFTAITRAKGWVRVSGIGDGAIRCQQEMDTAKSMFPFLEFVYPGPDALKVMKRDIAASADKKMQAHRLLDELLSNHSLDEIQAILKEKRNQADDK